MRIVHNATCTMVHVVVEIVFARPWSCRRLVGGALAAREHVSKVGPVCMVVCDSVLQLSVSEVVASRCGFVLGHKTRKEKCDLGY